MPSAPPRTVLFVYASAFGNRHQLPRLRYGFNVEHLCIDGEGGAGLSQSSHPLNGISQVRSICFQSVHMGTASHHP